MKSTTMTPMACMLILCGLFQASSAQKRPCCGPSQWEGFIHTTNGEANSAELKVENAELNYHYDHTRRMVAFDQKITSGSQTHSLKIFMDYPKGVFYHVFQGMCTKVNITKPMVSPCTVPTAATFMGSRNVAGVPVDTWLYQNSTIPGRTKTTRFTLTQKECILFNTASFTLDYRWEMHTVRYFNMTTGIKDPKVFDIPAECQTRGLQHNVPLESQQRLIDQIHKYNLV